MIGNKTIIRKNDQVMIMAGKEIGKTGKVLSVNRKKQTVLVEKLNLVKRHMKPSDKHKQGGIVEKEAPINVSNLMIFCNKCTKPVRVGKKFLDEKNLKKVRYCKKCGEVVDKI